ncbi:hypothetical protein BDA99DRAFT_534771 [Phascolomyces articulosus]|uniref:Uncharacterized protein n=1 Tax=Phascolomyces articulosus TaxID=60185 RepID=A0AAD5PGF5_9FUNG|nr:hypothetical protein BDA99DRAFT_534771 [Phascolomyces articulosus]
MTFIRHCYSKRRSIHFVWTLVVFVMVFLFMCVSTATSTQPIKEVLDSQQGYDTDLSDPTPFGYVFRIDAPFRRFGPDQKIHQHNKPKQDDDDDNPQSSFPKYAMMVLKNITYLSAEDPIYLEGYVSVDATHRLRKRSLMGSPITFQFSTYALDQVLQTWYQRFQTSGENANGIRGRMTGLRIVEKNDKLMDDGTLRPLVQMQISPIPGLVQTLLYKEGVNDEPMTVFWGPAKKDPKEASAIIINNKLIKDKTAAFHQIVMGDVLF